MAVWAHNHLQVVALLVGYRAAHKAVQPEVAAPEVLAVEALRVARVEVAPRAVLVEVVPRVAPTNLVVVAHKAVAAVVAPEVVVEPQAVV